MAASYNELFGLGTWSKDTAMQGWWRLQETTGTTASDSSGKGRNGTIVNMGANPVTTTGPNGWLPSTYRFNGSNHRVDLGDYRSDFTNAVTVLAFVRATASKVFPMAVSAAGAGGDGNEGFELRGGNNNNLIQFNVDESTGRPAASSVTSTLNVWSHVAGTYNGSSVIIYDDGVSASLSGSDNIAFGPASTWRIGDRGGGIGLPWQGDICDVVLFNRALTSSEVSEHRLGPEPLNTSAPSVTGTATVGSTLTCSTGSWNAQSNGTLSYTYQWKNAGSNISGATSSTYTIQSGDTSLTCVVRASNDGGYDAAQDTTSNTVTVSGGSASYSLTADQGSFTLSGQAAGLATGRLVTAGQGTFALSGQAANLLASRSLLVDQGAFALNGQAAGLIASRSIIAAQGAYSLAGQNVFRVSTYTLPANQGAFALTGQDAALIKPGSYSLTASQGSLAIAGQPVSLLASRAIAAAQGAFVLSGQPANLASSGQTQMQYIILQSTYSTIRGY